MNNLEDAHELIDTAISTALKESKPVYISISCNLPGIPHPTFARDPVPFFIAPKYGSQSLSLSDFGFWNLCEFDICGSFIINYMCMSWVI